MAALLREIAALLARPDADFTWSSWRDGEHALEEVGGLLAMLDAGAVPNRGAVAVLFLPTGPLQETALGSGWGDHFLALADRHDAIAARLWPRT